MDAERGNWLELGDEVRDVLVGLGVADLDVAVREIRYARVAIEMAAALSSYTTVGFSLKPRSLRRLRVHVRWRDASLRSMTSAFADERTTVSADLVR